ncbi:hypothetical protein GGD92_02955 [Pseudomonas protegens]|uniref:MafI family immunity protein n=1 Tax=Pseudomonas protegens TaxID=380021 RepID=A0A7G8YNK7_9PSED|nr:hypothetical protein [Pseudomonas protegens]QNH77255.1 hypothetical protein GGI48_29090 [Pseudomonas protegens]QNL06451.1 hypothetical protein GGD92_02955 [Pseudomonas protegens]
MPERIPCLRADFIEVLDEVEPLLVGAYKQLGPVPQDHALAQAGLEHGRAIVLDYLEHNEAGCAFEHLLYMINEPALGISAHCRAALARLAEHLGMSLKA